jgi:hypothetical protein
MRPRPENYTHNSASPFTHQVFRWASAPMDTILRVNECSATCEHVRIGRAEKAHWCVAMSYSD